MIGLEEARRREESFLGNLSGAQDDYEWIVTNRAWVELGWDTFAGWWDDRVRPIMRALSMRPTREIAAAVVEQVRQEEADLPSAQRRRDRELAEMVGATPDEIRDRAGRSTSAGIPTKDDLARLESFTSRPPDSGVEELSTPDPEAQVEAVTTCELSPEEVLLLAEQEEAIELPVSNLDQSIFYALSNRVDPMLVVGWLTAARHRLAALGGDEPSAAVTFIFDPRIDFVLHRGRAVADELAGPDLHRKPLTTDELADLAAAISGGTA